MQTPLKKYLPEFVYGGIDGAITTFAIVAGVVGASLPAATILILGFANVLADGFSMGISNYLSQASENDLKRSERKNNHKTSLATFISFVLVGLIPLSPYIVGLITGVADETFFVWSTIMTLIAFYGIGYLKGVFTKNPRHGAALQTLAMGATAALISYGVGYALRSIA